MSNYSHDEYPKFFSSITRAFIEEPGFYDFAIRSGFDPESWPEVSAKNLAINFHKVAQKKSTEFAQLNFSKLSVDLEPINFSQDSNFLICLFNELKMFGLGRDLGHAILNAPSRASELIERFKNQRSGNVVVKNFKEEITSYLEHHKLKNNAKQKKVILKGWQILSKGIGGFNPGRVILIVAGTGVGKTTLSLNLILSSIKDFSTLLFNMEMSLEDIYDRFCMIGSGLSSYQWDNLVSKENLNKTAEFISEIYRSNNFFVTDGSSLTIEQISSAIYSKKESDDLKLIFVDYDQKIRTKFLGEEWQALQKAVEELEEVAKSTNTCIVILSQGDDNNLPKASKRSMQAASAVLSFYQEGKDYFIEAKKNRFGRRGFKVKVSCDFSSFKISEDCEVSEESNFRNNKENIKGAFDVV